MIGIRGTGGQGFWAGRFLLPPPPPLQMHTPARTSQCWSRQTQHGLGVCIWMHLLNGPGNSPSPGRPTPGVVKQDKSSRGSVDTTKTRSGPQRVRMSSGERPTGAANNQIPRPCANPPPPPLLLHAPLQTLGPVTLPWCGGSTVRMAARTDGNRGAIWNQNSQQMAVQQKGSMDSQLLADQGGPAMISLWLVGNSLHCEPPVHVFVLGACVEPLLSTSLATTAPNDRDLSFYTFRVFRSFHNPSSE